jgi:hypothetical protein
MVQVEVQYDVALRMNPHKKGVKLFHVTQPERNNNWVWARTKEQALAAIAAIEGWKAYPHHVGSVIEETDTDGLFDGGFNS